MNLLNTKIVNTALLASGLILFTACGGGGGGGDNTPPADTNTSTAPTSITFNGITYGFITSPYTGKVWLDKNLGAARVCEQFDDSACFGDYYQWGRAADGHQNPSSGTTNTQSANVFNTETNGYIISHQDWATVDEEGTTRNLNWSKTDGSSICPVGFRVPSIIELRAETIDAGVTNKIKAFENFMKIPTAGYRDYLNGALTDSGDFGYLWSSTPEDTQAVYIRFEETVASTRKHFRSWGFPVRCIKN